MNLFCIGLSSSIDIRLKIYFGTFGQNGTVSLLSLLTVLGRLTVQYIHWILGLVQKDIAMYMLLGRFIGIL